MFIFLLDNRYVRTVKGMREVFLFFHLKDFSSATFLKSLSGAFRREFSKNAHQNKYTNACTCNQSPWESQDLFW